MILKRADPFGDSGKMIQAKILLLYLDPGGQPAGGEYMPKPFQDKFLKAGLATKEAGG